MRIFDEYNKFQEPPYLEMSLPTSYTSILIVNQLGVILFGTLYGSIKGYLWPFYVP